MNQQLFHRAALFGAAGILLIGPLGAEEKKAPAGPPAPPPAHVLVEKVIELNESAGKKYVGHLQAIEEVELRARVSGNINTVRFKEGDQVKAGQLLFELEDTTYRAKVMAAKAQLDQIEAELKYATENYNRQKTLRDSNAVAQSIMDEADRLLASTKAKKAEAEAALLDAENNLSYTKIHAPINGRIGKLTYTQGNYVTTASDKLADIVQISPVYVNFAISERDFLSLFGNADAMKKSANLKLKLSDDSVYGKPGQVTFIDNKVDQGTNTLTIWATFDNPDAQLMPGGFVTVELSKKTEKSYPAIHLSAVITEAKGNYVYVVDQDNKAIRRDISPGPMIGSLQVVYSGVAPGETVIIDGTHKVRPGAVVNPIPAKK